MSPMEQHSGSWELAKGTTVVPAETGGKEKMDDGHRLVPALRFAPGFRFLPTDEELVVFYLLAKIKGRRPPLDVVVEVPNILDHQPHKLVEDFKRYGENRWFFFTKRKPSASNKENEPCRKLSVEAADGVDGFTASWKATGSVAGIRRSRGEDRKVIGTKRILIYHSNVPGEGGKWSMNEFVSADYPGMNQWVLCTIQTKLHWGSNRGSDKKCEKETSMEPKTTKRKEKAATSHAQEETTLPDGSAYPPPLFMHEQHHDNLHEGHPMSLTNDTSLITHPAIAQYVDHHHFEDLQAMQQEVTYDHPVDQDQQYHLVSHNAFQYGQDHQLSASVQMYPQYTPNNQPKDPQYTPNNQPKDSTQFDYQWQQQQQPQQVVGYADQLEVKIVPVNSQETIMALPGQNNHMVKQTSPNTVLRLPLANSHPYYNDNYVSMMFGGASTMTSNYSPSTDHQSSSGKQAAVSAGDPSGDGHYMPGFADGFLNYSSEDSFIGNKGEGGNPGMTVLPDMSNQASPMCRHGVELWGNVKCCLC